MMEEQYDRIACDLIFALRDSLTEVSRLDFWAGRATTAVETAVAGAESWEQMVTIASHKLQIETLTKESAASIVKLAAEVGDSFTDWCNHVGRNIVYIVALANVERELRKPTKKTHLQEAAF